jgi:hypothetical protein
MWFGDALVVCFGIHRYWLNKIIVHVMALNFSRVGCHSKSDEYDEYHRIGDMPMPPTFLIETTIPHNDLIKNYTKLHLFPLIVMDSAISIITKLY